MSTRSAREYQASKGIGVGPNRSRGGGLGGGGGGFDPGHFSDAGDDPSNLSRGPGRSNPSATGTKHPDETLQKMNAVNQPPMTEVEKAIMESKRQRKIQKPGLDLFSTLLGIMPAPGLGAAFTVGQWMGEASEEEASKRPGDFSTNKKDPGSVYSNSGAKYSNRAEYPGHDPDPGNRTNSEEIRRKRQGLPTLLGATPAPLGTADNPIMIT